MTVGNLRAQFEAAAKTRWPSNHRLLLRINHPGIQADGQYENPIVEHAWWAWQASREAVAVSLPRITGHEYDPLADADYREGCREAIEAQGLKVLSHD